MDIHPPPPFFWCCYQLTDQKPPTLLNFFFLNHNIALKKENFNRIPLLGHDNFMGIELGGTGALTV
jgi:hypothetical protein